MSAATIPDAAVVSRRLAGALGLPALCGVTGRREAAAIILDHERARKCSDALDARGLSS